MLLTAVANARKDAESQLGTLDRALRMRFERRMREETENDGNTAKEPVKNSAEKQD